jgi:hypothetical protein
MPLSSRKPSIFEAGLSDWICQEINHSKYRVRINCPIPGAPMTDTAADGKPAGIRVTQHAYLDRTKGTGESNL